MNRMIALTGKFTSSFIARIKATVRPRLLITIVVAIIALIGGFVLAQAPSAFAAVMTMARLSIPNIPATFNYQGYLRDDQGNLVTGTYNITANIYDDPESGNLIHSETIENVNVRDGRFNIVLGDLVPLGTTFDGVPRYIGISLNSEPELIPRERVHGVPWAIHASDASNASNADHADVADLAGIANAAYRAGDLNTMNIAEYHTEISSYPLEQSLSLELYEDAASGDAMCFLTEVQTSEGFNTGCIIDITPDGFAHLITEPFNYCSAVCIRWDRQN
jgi:hypothetical protein